MLFNFVQLYVLSLSAMLHANVTLEGFGELSYLLSFPLLLKDMRTDRLLAKYVH